MKTVGKQLQEARQARNWTPELAARETKIKVERLKDLESDDYSHFSSPTYARGFVRTYARALGLDEYTILRQLDNKLPDDDSANIVTDTGVAYLPETAMPPRAAHRDLTGLYVITGLGGLVALVIVFVLFEAYRVGELSRYFGTSPSSDVAADTNVLPATNVATAASTNTDTVARALPVDSNTPPPIPEAVVASPPPAPKATPVDVSEVASTTNVDVPAQSVRALPVDPAELTGNSSASPANIPPPVSPRALPVSASELAAAPGDSPEAAPGPPVAVVANTPPANGPVMQPSSPAVAPTPDPAPSPDSSLVSGDSDKRLVLTASRDSFVRVTDLESSQPLYSAVLHSGQSIGFDGRKFSINVDHPSAVDIKLDGVNYGPHSDGEHPETFRVESHLP